MAVTVRQIEGAVAAPLTHEGLSAETLAALWHRLEQFVAHRWVSRTVTWTVEGEGCWTPPLAPVTSITSAEVWERGAWSPLTLTEGPYGYEFDGDGPYRIVARVGASPVPAPVAEAFARLCAHASAEDRMPGASSFREQLGPSEIEVQRRPDWQGRILHTSGAADLLRPYRRA